MVTFITLVRASGTIIRVPFWHPHQALEIAPHTLVVRAIHKGILSQYGHGGGRAAAKERDNQVQTRIHHL